MSAAEIERAEPVSERRLTILYVGALSTIALLCIIGQITVQRIIAQQTDDSSLINTAGRQRMLSQRIAKSALAIQACATDPERAPWRAQLGEMAELFASSHVAPTTSVCHRTCACTPCFSITRRKYACSSGCRAKNSDQ